MLVQFMLKNVLSFREETTFDMTAINAYKEHPCNLANIGLKENFLKVASIYGANASGKSNLCSAMSLFQKLIRESLNNSDNEGIVAVKRYYMPFSFEDDSGNSEFQIIHILGDYEYKYGFEYNSERIVSEWLYRKNLRTNRNSTILERTATSVRFGSVARKDCDLFKDQIPQETLALTFFNKLKIKTDVFRTMYSGIMRTLVVPSDFVDDYRILKSTLSDVIDDNKDTLLEFLNAIDSGIKDISYDDDGDKEVIFYTIHKGRNGKDYQLNLFLESEGTLKSIALFIYAQAAILTNSSLWVDELNIKLHPLLLKFIVDLFYKNNSTAQLIYTTHDTTLMDRRFFRRDQIWFVQKDEYGYSQLYSLSDYKVRSDASFEKDYLAGVYGGIPQLKDFSLEDGE